jgi:peptidoglycan/LPS O-acetylase OafA/YrhL
MLYRNTNLHLLSSMIIFFHTDFVGMTNRSDTELLGNNNQYLPKIVSIFAEVFFYVYFPFLDLLVKMLLHAFLEP